MLKLLEQQILTEIHCCRGTHRLPALLLLLRARGGLRYAAQPLLQVAYLPTDVAPGFLTEAAASLYGRCGHILHRKGVEPLKTKMHILTESVR